MNAASVKKGHETKTNDHGVGGRDGGGGHEQGMFAFVCVCVCACPAEVTGLTNVEQREVAVDALEHASLENEGVLMGGEGGVVLPIRELVRKPVVQDTHDLRGSQ